MRHVFAVALLVVTVACNNTASVTAPSPLFSINWLSTITVGNSETFIFTGQNLPPGDGLQTVHVVFGDGHTADWTLSAPATAPVLAVTLANVYTTARTYTIVATMTDTLGNTYAAAATITVS